MYIVVSRTILCFSWRRGRPDWRSWTKHLFIHVRHLFLVVGRQNAYPVACRLRCTALSSYLVYAACHKAKSSMFFCPTVSYLLFVYPCCARCRCCSVQVGADVKSRSPCPSSPGLLFEDLSVQFCIFIRGRVLTHSGYFATYSRSKVMVHARDAIPVDLTFRHTLTPTTPAAVTRRSALCCAWMCAV